MHPSESGTRPFFQSLKQRHFAEKAVFSEVCEFFPFFFPVSRRHLVKGRQFVSLVYGWEFPRLSVRTPKFISIPLRPLDWRSCTSHSSLIDSRPPRSVCYSSQMKTNGCIHPLLFPPPQELLVTLLCKSGCCLMPKLSVHLLPSPWSFILDVRILDLSLANAAPKAYPLSRKSQQYGS